MSRLYFPQKNVPHRKTRKRQATLPSLKANFSLFHFVAILATKGFLTNHFGFFALSHAFFHTAAIPATGFRIGTKILYTFGQFGFGIFFFHVTNEIMAKFNEMAEREGFEPPVPYGTPDFESGTFDHSATSPLALNDSFSRIYRQEANIIRKTQAKGNPFTRLPVILECCFMDQ